jgi:hypothetical protein
MASLKLLSRAVALALALALACGLPAPALADEPGLTFFGWSDQHVTTKGE